LHDASRRIDRVEASRERLSELGAQLIGLEQQTPDVLLENVLPSDAAHPNPGRHGKRDRKSDDQPHGAGAETAPGIHRAKPTA
jgi:hypothetical protein